MYYIRVVLLRSQRFSTSRYTPLRCIGRPFGSTLLVVFCVYSTVTLFGPAFVWPTRCHSLQHIHSLKPVQSIVSMVRFSLRVCTFVAGHLFLWHPSHSFRPCTSPVARTKSFIRVDIHEVVLDSSSIQTKSFIQFLPSLPDNYNKPRDSKGHLTLTQTHLLRSFPFLFIPLNHQSLSS